MDSGRIISFDCFTKEQVKEINKKIKKSTLQKEEKLHDAGNVSKKLREGWAFLRAETLKSEIGPNEYPVVADGKYVGMIGVSGLVLARIPEEIVKSRTEYFKRISADQMDAVDSNLMKEQQPGMKINIDRQSRVTFGGGQKSK